MNTGTIRTRKFVNRITVVVLAVIVSLLCTACPQNGGGAPDNNTVSYAQVSFVQLDEYLKATASDNTVKYIEVTGLTKDAVKGTATTASPLGEILKAHSSKKVALKFGGKIEGLTDMFCCFNGCTNLIYAPAIPTGITDMAYCFTDCTNLVEAPEIPEGVTDISGCFNNCKKLTQTLIIPASVSHMYSCFSDCISLKTVILKCNYNPEKDKWLAPSFKEAFGGCTNLIVGGIKVPAGQLATYQANATLMSVTADKFAAE